MYLIYRQSIPCINLRKDGEDIYGYKIFVYVKLVKTGSLSILNIILSAMNCYQICEFN